MRATLIESAGARLHVERRGPEHGTPLLFLHAFPLSARMWAPQLEAFARGYSLFAPDLRGHGQSDAGDGQYTMELLVDDLFVVLDALELPPVVACGLSLGGYVLLRALEREPDRFRGVVLADTRSLADDDAGRLARAEAIRALKADGAAAFAESFAPRLLGRSTLERRPELRDVVVDMIRKSPVLGMCGAQLAMAARTDTTGALRALRVPALVLVGEEDTLTPPELAREMASTAAGAELVILPEAGHLANLENPDAFNHALGTFLEEIDARGR